MGSFDLDELKTNERHQDLGDSKVSQEKEARMGQKQAG